LTERMQLQSLKMFSEQIIYDRHYLAYGWELIVAGASVK